MIAPASEASTIVCNPLRRAARQMMNSAALPNVALSNPPMPSPVRAARSSVAFPIQPAHGTIATAATATIQAGRTRFPARAASCADLTARSITSAIPAYSAGTIQSEKRSYIGTSRNSANTKPLTPDEPGYVTQRFPENQGQFQVRYVGKNVSMQSLGGDLAAASYIGSTRTYNIQNGKIVTDLVGTPIEIAVYKVGGKYLAARSNEFGYANYEIVPAVTELAPIR